MGMIFVFVDQSPKMTIFQSQEKRKGGLTGSARATLRDPGSQQQRETMNCRWSSKSKSEPGSPIVVPRLSSIKPSAQVAALGTSFKYSPKLLGGVHPPQMSTFGGTWALSNVRFSIGSPEFT